MHNNMKRIFIILLLAIATFAKGQIVKFDSIIYDTKLSNPLLEQNDSIYNEFEKSKVAINAKCATRNSVPVLDLNACDCFMKGDTIFIDIDRAPCPIPNEHLYIKIIADKFTTINIVGLLFGSPLIAYPIAQKLILQTRNFEIGEYIKGFIDFNGKGNFTKKQIKESKSFPGGKMKRKQIKEGFKFEEKGYFKCKLKNNKSE